jgi:hypothetical protein
MSFSALDETIDVLPEAERTGSSEASRAGLTQLDRRLA